MSLQFSKVILQKMKNDLKIEWEKFIKHKLECFNPPVTEEILSNIDNKLGFKIPDDLKNLYKINNGQRENLEKGVFKNVSGENLYSRVRFLKVQDLINSFKLITSDDELKEEFKDEFLPFAIEHKESLGNCYAISLKTNKIYILWTDYLDPFNPPAWQIWAFF